MAATHQITPVSVPAISSSARGIMPKRRGEIVQATIESRFGSLAELGVPLAVLGIVMAMIAPMPSFPLDFLISANITCTSSDGKVGIDAKKQILSNPQPLMLAGSAGVAMAAFPGLPTLSFLLLGSSAGYFGYRLRRISFNSTAKDAESAPEPVKDNLDALLKVEPLAIDVGLGLVKLVDGAQSSPLLRRIAAIRKPDRIAEDHPKVIGNLVPQLLPMAIVQKVFQSLLRERVSIRDSVTILEALGIAK
jgi:flagellar biosynthesis component FlhA